MGALTLGTHAIILVFVILSLCSEMLVLDTARRDLHSPEPNNGAREENAPFKVNHHWVAPQAPSA